MSVMLLHSCVRILDRGLYLIQLFDELLILVRRLVKIVLMDGLGEHVFPDVHHNTELHSGNNPQHKRYGIGLYCFEEGFEHINALY